MSLFYAILIFVDSVTEQSALLVQYWSSIFTIRAREFCIFLETMSFVFVCSFFFFFGGGGGRSGGGGMNCILKLCGQFERQ